MMGWFPDHHKAPDLTSQLPGRQDEQELLLRLLNGLDRGDGSVVLVSGEAGIGKTTLIERAAQQARVNQVLVVVGNCYRTSSIQPLYPWRELRTQQAGSYFMRSSLDAIDAAGSREELHERVASDLREAAREQPILIILEDIHWADTASLELLRYLARQISTQGVMLIATCRSDEPDPAAGLREILPEIVRESRAHRLELSRLDYLEIQAFLQSETGPDLNAPDLDSLGKYLLERSGGNPFFMTELLRDLGPDLDEDGIQNLPVPSLVRQVVEIRVDRLNKSTRSLLETASVIGQDVPIELWQEVSGASEEVLTSAIEECIQNHLIQESNDGRSVRFVHGLIQETLYNGQVALRRRRIHRAISERLLERGAPPAAMIAHHFALAGDVRSIDWFVRSAGEALALYAARDAISAIDQAESMASESGIRLPLDAYRIRAQARQMLGEHEQARSDLARLLELSRKSEDHATECQALLDFGMLWAAQDYQECGRYFNQAMEIASKLGDIPLHAHCVNRLANWQANIGELDSAIELHQRALQMFEEIGHQDGIGETLDLLGTTSFLAGEYPDARDYLERSVAISRDQGNKWRLASSLALLSNVGGDMDSTFDASTVASRPAEYWISAGDESIAISREIGWISGESFGLSMLGATHCVRGNLGKALECAEAAEKIAHRINHQQWLVSASLVLGVTWGELLDQSRAEHYLERTLGHARAMGSHLWTFVTIAALANVRLQRNDLSGRDLLLPFLETEGTGKAHSKRAFQFAWANQLRAAHELDDALAFADRLLGYNDPSTGFAGTPQILKLKADILGDLGQVNEASDLLDEADRIAARLGFRAMHWRVQLSRGELELSRGDHRVADDWLESAREIAGEIARDLPDPELRRRFIRAVETKVDSIRVPVESPANPAGLSPRELDVLKLVSRGNTDAQVAETLFISPRTVARHLQSIYTKLNVNSRTAATRLAIDRDLIPRR